MKKIIVILMIFILMTLLVACDKSIEDKIIDVAKEKVLENIISPTSAKFPDKSKIKIKKIDDNSYSVLFYVDSMNKNGVMIRNDVLMLIVVEDGKYKIEDWMILER